MSCKSCKAGATSATRSRANARGPLLAPVLRHVKIALLYNANAGDGLSPDHVRRALEKGGHEIVQVLRETPELVRLRRDAIDVLVVAGGDGTVAQAAGALVGGHVPMAILPLGTANNIAA